MRALLWLAFCAVPMKGLCCSVPMHGPEFDSLIVVKDLSERNVFSVSVPKRVGKLEFGVSVLLAYAKQDLRESSIKLAEETNELKTVDQGEHVTIELTVQKKAGLRPYVLVFWHSEAPGLCGAVGSTPFLQLR